MVGDVGGGVPSSSQSFVIQVKSAQEQIVEDDRIQDIVVVDNTPAPTRGGKKSIATLWLSLIEGCKNLMYSILFILRDMTNPQELPGNIYLVIWFIANITITLTSKSLFSNFRFPYPMILTTVHLFTTWLMAQGMATFRVYRKENLTVDKIPGLLLFSLVFTINIWLSNYALLFVSVPVHQVTRTTVPLFTMFLSVVIWKEWYPLRMIPSVLVVIVGVIFTLTWDIHLSIFGAVIVLVGCAFSSLKGLMSQKAQIGPQGLPTFDLLRFVCPLSVIQLIFCAACTGELQLMLGDIAMIREKLVGTLVMQGVLAAGLNFVSFKCAALKNPLTMNIAGNVKQTVTPVISLWLFGGAFTAALGAGLGTTFVGALWYGKESRLRSRLLVAAAETKTADVLEEVASSSPKSPTQAILRLGPGASSSSFPQEGGKPEPTDLGRKTVTLEV